ncbi:MAG: hypothetical protein VW982_07665 [Candidatus Poseidoniales archaeon]
MLLTDYVEEQATLGAALNATETVVSFALPSTSPAGVVAGATIEVGAELMYVFSVTSGAATVLRGYKGSEATTHALGALVTINPKFPTYQILDALNHELRDLSSPQNGLFQIKTVEVTFNAAQDGYDLTGVTDDVLSIYQVTYSDPGSEASEPAITEYALRRDRNTSAFPSGYGLILHSDAWPGETVRVLYKTGFSTLAAATTALSTTGLHSEAYDLPVLGAALRLMSSRPIRREFLDEQGSSRMADEVPPGAVSASMRDLRALRLDRMNAEATRLDGQYPAVWTRSGGRTQTSIYRGV